MIKIYTVIISVEEVLRKIEILVGCEAVTVGGVVEVGLGLLITYSNPNKTL